MCAVAPASLNARKSSKSADHLQCEVEEDSYDSIYSGINGTGVLARIRLILLLKRIPLDYTVTCTRCRLPVACHFAPAIRAGVATYAAQDWRVRACIACEGLFLSSH